MTIQEIRNLRSNAVQAGKSALAQGRDFGKSRDLHAGLTANYFRQATYSENADKLKELLATGKYGVRASAFDAIVELETRNIDQYVADKKAEMAASREATKAGCEAIVAEFDLTKKYRNHSQVARAIWKMRKSGKKVTSPTQAVGVTIGKGKKLELVPLASVSTSQAAAVKATNVPPAPKKVEKMEDIIAAQVAEGIAKAMAGLKAS